jgi:hypothetical protein
MHGSTESIASASMLPDPSFGAIDSSYIDTMPQIKVMDYD